MTNIDKVAVLSTALSALSVREATSQQASKVADMLADSCQKLTAEEVDSKK